MMGMGAPPPRLPAILVAIVLAAVFSWLIGDAAKGGEVVGLVASGFPAFSLPHWPSWSELGTWVVPADLSARLRMA